jgi:hypothetical protein
MDDNLLNALGCLLTCAGRLSSAGDVSGQRVRVTWA